MSDKILVRTAGGDVLNVPAMRLSWARDHEELLGLMDWYKAYVLDGSWATMTHKGEIEQLEKFLAEVAKVAKVTLADEKSGRLDCDLGDIRKIYHALRGVGADADPTAPPPG